MKDQFTVSASYVPLTLKFKFEAGTSRGVLNTKENYLIRLTSSLFPGISGVGEAGPLVGLSIDHRADFEECLKKILRQIEEKTFSPQPEMVLKELRECIPIGFPSILFALETAMLDLLHGGKRRIGANGFFDARQLIPINGLVWMGDQAFMQKQIEEKLEAGYSCIKMKMGAIDFDTECGLLAAIRKRYSKDEITLRVDANGAFTPQEAMGKLERLSAYHIHSIEQPIKQGQWEEMARLCEHSPVAIALDEELIGINTLQGKADLLDTLNPSYIILKPTLVGGISASRTWIQQAEQRGIGWWMTSALESNIGLNAIAQLTSSYNVDMPQGLGTGQLYHNNIASPLRIDKGNLWYDKKGGWEDIQPLFVK